jgi:hypothetical protein
VHVDRREYEKNALCLKRGSFFKPALNRMETGGRILMVKDVGRKHFLSRWTLGYWLIHKEWKIYSRLTGVHGIPKAVERIDRFSFALEFISGRPIGRGENLPSSFFSKLEMILRKVHLRGVVHLDLRHKGNILVSDGGEPFLIDFNSSFSFKEGGFLRRFLFPFLTWVDYGGLLKLKERVAPVLLTLEEQRFLKEFNRLRKLWVFN